MSERDDPKPEPTGPWKPAYKVPKGTSARHAEAYRARAGIVGRLLTCICTWPLDEDSATISQHSEFCPFEIAAKRVAGVSPARGDDMSDPKTTDYCTRCGESPESGNHSFKHAYVSPHGLLCSPLPVEVDATELGTAAMRNANLGIAPPVPGAVRVKCEDRPGMPQFGVFVGMLLDEHSEVQAIVRLDHYGLLLKAFHPSKVTPVTPDEEAAYK